MKGSKIALGMDEFQKNFILFLLMCSLIITAISAATYTLDGSQTVRDGDTLVSSGGIFELGFFSPGNPTDRYLGIWYKNITDHAVVWVANREVPLTTKSGVLRVTERGILTLLNESSGVIIWSSNTSRPSLRNPTAQLLDSGNIVVKDVNDDRLESENFIWQSFDHPSDTYLPGMRLGWDFVTGVETYISSWRSNDDPAPGQFTAHVDPTGYPQLIIRRAKAVYYRFGPCNGFRFSGIADTSYEPAYGVSLRMNKNEVKYMGSIVGRSVIYRATLNPSGVEQRLTWDYRTNSWNIHCSTPSDTCDTYNLCGEYGSCDIGNSLSYRCLDRFVPKDAESWSRREWSSNGCVRRTPLNCQDDVFLKYFGIQLPDSQNSSFNDQIILLADCKAECSRNCSCVAYTQLNISGEGSGCLFYHGELIDIRTSQNGQDLYIRMASTELASKGEKRVILIASFTSVVGIVLLCLSLILICTWRKKKDLIMRKDAELFSGSHGKEAELPFFNFSTILKATDSFSIVNKLGQGGFGPVYKGTLEDGQEIAVKRLSKSSSQGVDELKNEVILIAKLQHRNLVRLLGCCIQGEENMLIYEYMPNNSLDLILFDQRKSILLDWKQRFRIINGIDKGLLYLHEDSRLRIIHRDLKASNILLDADMKPKISDFGLARSFGENETEAKTRRVVGTYGYMSPEYAIDGLFSIKSDVFSFGVLVLEVVSGKRNRGFSLQDHNLNLLGHTWTLYKEDNSCKLLDTSLGDSFDLSEVLQSIHVGLLCVQKSADDRPSMSSVVVMLGNEVALPEAKQPGFFTERDVVIAQSSSQRNSVNQVTITLPEGR